MDCVGSARRRRRFEWVERAILQTHSQTTQRTCTPLLILSGRLIFVQRPGEDVQLPVYALPRQIEVVPIKLPDGATIQFSPGEHNLLQKAIIEKFLPRYGFGAEVLYVGDTAKKFLVRSDAKLKALKFFELEQVTDEGRCVSTYSCV